MTELGQALGNNVTARFVQLVTTDKQAQALAREALESASYETANRYSVRTGELMGQALADETQTLAYMSYDVARETLTPLMTANHEAVTAVTNTIQTNMNQAAGVGLAPAPMVLDTSRIDGLSAVVAQCDTMAQAREVIAEPLINSSQSIVDRGIRDNAKANSKAGLKPVIVRETDGAGERVRRQFVKRNGKTYGPYMRTYEVPCKWCGDMAGEYDYESVKNTGNDVYRRHESCRCLILYKNGTKYQDVRSKAEFDESDRSRAREIIAERERQIEQNRIAEERRKQQYSANIRKIAAELGYSDKGASIWWAQNYDNIQRYGLDYMLDYTRNNNKWRANPLYPPAVGGAKRGARMTPEQADSGHVNPNFVSGRNGAYENNCQSCVVAYEARLRGYDVEVLGFDKDDEIFTQLSRDTRRAWRTVDGSPVSPLIGSRDEWLQMYQTGTFYNAKTYEQALHDTMKPNERYHLNFPWRGRNAGGHIVTIDISEDDVLHIYDPQTNRHLYGAEVSKYLKGIKYKTQLAGETYPTYVQLTRVDNLEFNPEYTDHILKAN